MKKGFTLIELLVVIAIVAVLAVVVVLTLNPVVLFQQERDASRVSDMGTLNKAISLYYSDALSNPGTLFMGTSSFIYVSIPDPSATSTAGDQCQGLGLPAAPTGYTYQCAPSSTYLNVNGTGWIPINFNSYLSGKAGSVISKLPVDPVNQTSSGLYYTYSTDGVGNYEVTSIFQSQKYKAQYATTVLDPDYPEVDAKGVSLSLSPLFNPSGLIGWWPLNEGSGTTAYDQSSNGNNATWGGTKIGGSGYYAAGKVGSYAADFDGSTDSATSTATMSDLTTNFTIVAWVIKNSNTAQEAFFSNRIGAGEVYFGISGSNIFIYNNLASPASAAGGTVTFGQWQQIAAVATSSAVTFYVNGTAVYSASWTNGDGGTGSAQLGYDQSTGNYWGGLMNDVRVYNRALSAAEIQALYNAEK